MMLARPALAHRRLERQQLLVAQLPLADMDGSLVQPAFGEPVPDQVLAGGEDALLQVVGLQPADVRDAHRHARYGSSP